MKDYCDGCINKRVVFKFYDKKEKGDYHLCNECIQKYFNRTDKFFRYIEKWTKRFI